MMLIALVLLVGGWIVWCISGREEKVEDLGELVGKESFRGCHF